MKQGWTKAALSAAAISGVIQAAQAAPVPGVHLSDAASACTSDGERVTLSYTLEVSPHFYWNTHKLSTPELKTAFLNELEGKVVQPMDVKWVGIAARNSAADMRARKAAPQDDFLRAAQPLVDAYGMDRTSNPNIELLLTGAMLSPDPSCRKPD